MRRMVMVVIVLAAVAIVGGYIAWGRTNGSQLAGRVIDKEPNLVTTQVTGCVLTGGVLTISGTTRRMPGNSYVGFAEVTLYALSGSGSSYTARRVAGLGVMQPDASLAWSEILTGFTRTRVGCGAGSTLGPLPPVTP
jgi:hypothetical protein